MKATNSLGLAMLAALLVLLAAAAVQAQLPPSLTISVEPLPIVRPLQGVVGANVTIDVSCAMVQPGQPTVSGQFMVTSSPSWSSAVTTPSTFVVDPAGCGSSTASVEVHAKVAVSATQDAPAGTGGKIVVHASTNGVPNASASAEISVEVAFFGQLDVNIPESIAVVRPGDAHAFKIKLSNFGNDATVVRATLVNATNGFSAALFPDTTLQSKQQGAVWTSSDVSINVTGPAGSGVVNQIGSVSVLIESFDAKDPKLAGDTSHATFVLTAKGLAVGNPARQLDGEIPVLGIAAIAIVAAGTRRARS